MQADTQRSIAWVPELAVVLRANLRLHLPLPCSGTVATLQLYTASGERSALGHMQLRSGTMVSRVDFIPVALLAPLSICHRRGAARAPARSVTVE